MDHKMDCCRTCLNTEKEMRNIHTVITIAGDEVRLSDILETFYKYQVYPEEAEIQMLPENICITCVHQLTITYSFKVLIENTYKSLMDMASPNSTHEDEDIHFDAEDTKYEVFDEFEDTVQPKSKKLSVKVKKSAKKALYCIECKNKFRNVVSLYEHYTKNHEQKSSIGRECEYCTERFEDFRTLVLHRKMHMRPYVCEKCWEGYYTTTDYEEHHCIPKLSRKEKNKLDRMLRQCDQCGKSYPPGYISIHMRTHSDDRPYHCKYCPKKFKVPGGLHSHVLWNHKRTRNHQCDICNATFVTASSKSTHIRKNHLKEKKYVCKCGKRFFSKSELDRHDLTHTGLKNFHCHLCEKSYQTRYGLNVHLKSHTQINMMNSNNILSL